jgi:hypothetical protein
MDVYIPQLPLWITLSVLAAAIAAALWRGGLEERVTAAVVAWPMVNNFVPGLRWSEGLPTDIVSLAICLALALRSRRYWTVWSAAANVLAVLTHLLDQIVELTTWAYQSALITWAYVMAVSLLVGALTRRRGEA